MIGGVVILLLAGRCHSLRDVEGATGQGASLASASGPPLHLLTAGRRLSLRDVEGAAGQGASLTSASGPPLHLWQQAAAALAEALARKVKRRIRSWYTDLWIRNVIYCTIKVWKYCNVLYYTILCCTHRRWFQVLRA